MFLKIAGARSAERSVIMKKDKVQSDDASLLVIISYFADGRKF